VSWKIWRRGRVADENKKNLEHVHLGETESRIYRPTAFASRTRHPAHLAITKDKRLPSVNDWTALISPPAEHSEASCPQVIGPCQLHPKRVIPPIPHVTYPTQILRNVCLTLGAREESPWSRSSSPLAPLHAVFLHVS